jgi:hypothetical protein
VIGRRRRDGMVGILLLLVLEASALNRLRECRLLRPDIAISTVMKTQSGGVPPCQRALLYVANTLINRTDCSRCAWTSSLRSQKFQHPIATQQHRTDIRMGLSDLDLFEQRMTKRTRLDISAYRYGYSPLG